MKYIVREPVSVDRQLRKSGGPPPGYHPIPGGRKGGYRKRVGGKYDYWYPEGARSVNSVKPFSGSTARRGTALWKLEHGQYPLATYGGEGSREPTKGAHVPDGDMATLLVELRPFVRKAAYSAAIALRIKDHGRPEVMEDLQQHATMGLLLALRTYQGGKSFLQHAKARVKTYTYLAARFEKGSIAIPTRVMGMMTKYFAAQVQARQAMRAEGQSGDPSVDAVAEVLRLKKKDVAPGSTKLDKKQGDESAPLRPWRIRLPNGKRDKSPAGLMPGKADMVEMFRSIEAGRDADLSVFSQTGDVFEAVIPSQDPTPEDIVLGYPAKLGVRSEIEATLDSMDPDKALVLRARFGLLTEDGSVLSAKETAKRMGVSTELSDSRTYGIVKAAENEALLEFASLATVRDKGLDRYIDGLSELADTDSRPRAGYSWKTLMDRYGDAEKAGLYHAAAQFGYGAQADATLRNMLADKATTDEVKRLYAIASRYKAKVVGRPTEYTPKVERTAEQLRAFAVRGQEMRDELRARRSALAANNVKYRETLMKEFGFRHADFEHGGVLYGEDLWRFHRDLEAHIAERRAAAAKVGKPYRPPIMAGEATREARKAGLLKAMPRLVVSVNRQ